MHKIHGVAWSIGDLFYPGSQLGLLSMRRFDADKLTRFGIRGAL